ncbi:MAG: N-formylglutamate amidohydrolase [Chelatococcus sp.]|uniref:N-formylglutamate amidohydrolase n=1 Tax=unclassified Chelatococcus TaxID=2638111 RepID=UPI001BD0B80F|nr:MULTISPECIES: N-formylglutamate amidohydrolase [unclassified Chelatococcus]CAH1663934.1 N-formylglutamate deformylase [Hyphomicrobiales bacterium]MBS7741638.1 N-formylglutamate amidohydrolase [Chelatococcus sp. HY11]MBX3536273.1 N-formylglutamate amidohydrolase [Chelatococcus sp.]MBX3544343.1 N-formylglutamate amidohydrolase [Chelatococcus sp.]MCO5079133.1 N-formylglutamate amidohydrolase [Chelatococcus sp.]
MSYPVEPEFESPFQVMEPKAQTVSAVFNAPHSGRVYPKAFLATARLDPFSLRRSEDTHVDALFGAAVDLGAPLLTASFPRAYLDVNREPYELDPRMFEGRLPPFANTRSLRVAGGLGTVPRIVGDGQEIYREKLAVSEALRRIEWLYKPYHRTLRQLMARTMRQFGSVLLVDCHSMPSVGASREEPLRADFVLGDRYGTSCASGVTQRVEQELRTRGYRVVRNKPYAGGFITEHYGEPNAGRHALQIETNRALYMNERTLERSSDFERVATDLKQVLIKVLAALPDDLAPRAIAAE